MSKVKYEQQAATTYKLLQLYVRGTARVNPAGPKYYSV